jgi:hypothetical protein
MRTRSALLLLLLFGLICGVARAGGCPMQRYDRVVLFGTSDDPDVLLWDTRIRMRGYVDGSFDEMNALLPHARLLAPGTRAVVDACIGSYVQPSYMKSPDDAIGIFVLTGPLKGRYGWILGSDIRAVIHIVHRKP